MSTKFSAFLTVGLFALFHSLLASAQQTQQPTGPQQPPWGCPGPWHMHMWDGGWGFWWISPLIILLVIFVGAAIFLLGRAWGGGPHHWGPPWHMMDRPGRAWGDPTHSALQILNERFAKGEIQKQEYEEKKAMILSSR